MSAPTPAQDGDGFGRRKEPTGAAKIGELSVKLAEAALVARSRGDTVQALFFATKAAETLQLAKLLGWKPEDALAKAPSHV